MVKIKLKKNKGDSDSDAPGLTPPMLTTKVMDMPAPEQDLRKITFSRNAPADAAGEDEAEGEADYAAESAATAAKQSRRVAGTVFAIIGWLLSLGFGAGIFIVKDSTTKNMAALNRHRDKTLGELTQENLTLEREYAVSLAQFEEKKRQNEEEKINLTVELESLKKHQEEMQGEVVRQRSVSEGVQRELTGKSADLRGLDKEVIELKREVMQLRTTKQELERQYKNGFENLRRDLARLLSRGQIPELTAFSRSYFKSPFGPAAMFFLAERVYETAQTVTDAIPYYNNVLRVFPDSPYTNFTKERLEQINKRLPYTKNPYIKIFSHNALPFIK